MQESPFLQCCHASTQLQTWTTRLEHRAAPPLTVQGCFQETALDLYRGRWELSALHSRGSP